MSPEQLLHAIGKMIVTTNLIVKRPPGLSLFRARPRKANEHFTNPEELGPPPADEAIQSNRMNPPGLPMFYSAESRKLARLEVGKSRVSLGLFKTEREIRLLDLATLRDVPGTFSSASREEIMAMRFLHEFADLISQPVDRNERTKLDYIPTQVFSEFLRDYNFPGGPLDGIRYSSAAAPNDSHFDQFHEQGANVVLFATEADVVDGHHTRGAREHKPWLRLQQTWQYAKKPKNAENTRR